MPEDATARSEQQPAPQLDGHIRPLPFPVVAVGGSAGGLEAVTALLERLPATPGFAVLVVIHQSPQYKSELTAILRRATQVPVQAAEQDLPIEINTIYVGPAQASLALAEGRITLIPRPPRGVYMPIDALFRSLAKAQRSRSVGVILSGEGTDGTLGLQAIKAAGGITFAQDEKSARHDAMPRSAISEGYTDHIFSPPQIAQELVRLACHPYSVAPIEEGGEHEASQPAQKHPPRPGVAAATGVQPPEEAIDSIIALIRSNTQVDFSHYKQTTIERRIHRRMALRGLERLKDYLRVLREDPGELHALFQDLLIRVTQFFRDPEAFEILKEKVFPLLLTGRAPGTPIRIWVSGCSTGEEVYSLAICLLEYLATQPEGFPVKILATDLNEAALEKARTGVYVDNIELDVEAERLRRFFIRANGHYQINKSIRELCIFSRHNMATDPPFSRLDLISCRNVLIYMDAALQRRVLPILHYALNPGGFLFLGSSENVGPFTDLFAPIDPRHRLFCKKPASAPFPLDFSPYGSSAEFSGGQGQEERAPVIWSALDVQREADRIVLARYAPVGVVIDEAATVLQFRGRTAAYLEPAPGMASLDLLRMLREGLLTEVRSAIHQARAESISTTRDTLCLGEGRTTRPVRVEVIPFKVPPSGVRFFVVLFQDIQPTPPPEGPGPRPLVSGEARTPIPSPTTPPEQQASQLQQELAALREYLQSVIEEQESTNEELKSANEEILSANEELQSTNEELQTAKEEAQSANEELATVNEELRHRNAELGRVNNDLVNLLSGVNIPIVIISRDLRIRRFTPLAEKVFNLIPTDLGRPMSDIKPNLRIPDLVGLLVGVIDSLTPHESEVQDQEGHWYSLRIRPYITLDNKIDGASIVLLDIDSIKKTMERLEGRMKGEGSGHERHSQEPEASGEGEGACSKRG